MYFKVGEVIVTKSAANSSFVVIETFDNGVPKKIVEYNKAKRATLLNCILSGEYITFTSPSDASFYKWELSISKTYSEEIDLSWLSHPNKGVILKIKAMQKKRKDKGYAF